MYCGHLHGNHVICWHIPCSLISFIVTLMRSSYRYCTIRPTHFYTHGRLDFPFTLLFNKLPMSLMPLPAVCFMLIIALPPAFFRACTASLRILHKVCFMGSLRSLAAEWAAGISTGLLKPFIAGSAAPCVISVYMEDRLLPAFRAFGIGMPAYLIPLEPVFTKFQIIFSVLHITLFFTCPISMQCLPLSAEKHF